MYIEGDVPYVGTNNNNGGWNDWSWIIGLAVVGGIFGNGGFGFGNNGNRGNCATVQDVASGFSTSEIMSDLNAIILGQAQMQNFINQGFAGINQTVTNGFAGVNNAICTLGYQNQAGFNALATQLASCCCDLGRAIDGVNYNMATNTCNIIRANENNTKAILDFLTSEKIEALRAENVSLKGQISNDRQSRFIIDELRSGNCPVPAYVVQPSQPVTFPTNCCGNASYANFGYNGGCGTSVL
jgi:hypothetical protein